MASKSRLARAADELLVPDWRHAWRWTSARALVLAMVIVGGWNLMPASLLAYLPNWLGRTLAIAAIVLALIGMLVRNPKPPVPSARRKTRRRT